MKLSQFRFHLPPELIANHPPKQRDDVNMMVLDRRKQVIQHKHFKDILNYFGEGDVFIINNTKVFPALEFMGIMGVTAGSAALGRPLMCNGASMAYRKEAYLATGGYSGNRNYHSGDDQFLMMNIRRMFGRDSVRFVKDQGAIALARPCSGLIEFLEQRLRWASKGRGYSDPFVKSAGFVTALFPLILLAGGIAGIFIPALLVIVFGLWLVKLLAEYPLVFRMAGFFGKKHLLNYYFAAQSFQFFYMITVTAMMSFASYSWKGRRFRS